jgi:hypothetical protein
MCQSDNFWNGRSTEVITERELRRLAGRMGLGVGQAEYEYVVLCALEPIRITQQHEKR